MEAERRRGKRGLAYARARPRRRGETARCSCLLTRLTGHAHLPHALESIFGLLTLADLAHILAVSREWAAAVRSMKPIHAWIQRVDWQSNGVNRLFRPFPPIQSVLGSALLRHLAVLHISHAGANWTPLTSASLSLLAQHAPNLTSLWCKFTITHNTPLILPGKIKSLNLQFASKFPAAAINGVLTAVAALPSLSRLHFELSERSAEASVELRLLAACPSLTDLSIAGTPKLSNTQIDQIRLSLGHLHYFNVGGIKPKELARFLQPPVTARWRDIGLVWADARTGELLLRLPTITKLNLFYNQVTTHVDFLPQLSQLTTLDLFCYQSAGGGAWLIPADAVLASLVRCTRLTSLGLGCGLNSEQWSALFAKLALKNLTISRGGMMTLQCFAAGPITQSLVELTLFETELPPSEVVHLYALRRLRILFLFSSFSSPLDNTTINRLYPPSSILPALTALRHI